MPAPAPDHPGAPAPTTEKRDKVIEEFCRLSSEIAASMGWEEPADCFCIKSHPGKVHGVESQMQFDRYFSFSEKIIDTIREALKL